MELTLHVGSPILLPQIYKVFSVVLFFKTAANLHSPLSPMLLLQMFNLTRKATLTVKIVNGFTC